jgi:dihydrofolate reductase
VSDSSDAETSYPSQQCESPVFGGEKDIDCWVAGGEGIYKEALRHGNLREVRLTFVDMNIDANLHQFQMSNRVVFFPLDDFHRLGFDQVSKSVDGSCTFCFFKRRE